MKCAAVSKHLHLKHNIYAHLIRLRFFPPHPRSTVIKLITEELKPPEGEVRRNPRLRVGVYNQHFVDRLPMEEDPVSLLCYTCAGI